MTHELIRASSYFPKCHPSLVLSTVNLDARVQDSLRAARLYGYRLDPEDVREYFLCIAQEVIDNQDEHIDATIYVARVWLAEGGA